MPIIVNDQNGLVYYMLKGLSHVVAKWTFMAYADSKASGKLAHPCSLVKSFTVCLKLFDGLLLSYDSK